MQELQIGLQYSQVWKRSQKIGETNHIIPNNHVFCKLSPSYKVFAEGFISNRHRVVSGTFDIAEHVHLNESNSIAVKKEGHLKIGKSTYITRATIACLDRIEIGENCILGEGLKIFDHNHQYTREPFSVSKTEFNTAPVKIGNNVWSGANCIILKGVTIGENVILGAGCVIHKDVPANSVIINKQNLEIKPI